MRTNNNLKIRTNAANQRSYFGWSDGMQVVRKGYGEIAMTENELVSFFGVTWRKLNYRLQILVKSSNLHPDERSAGEEKIVIKGQFKGYAPLYPLPIIIVLSFMLDSTEAHLFRKHICQELQNTAFVIRPIFLFGNTDN